MAVIYGAKASGKTNVIRAIQFMSSAVGSSQRSWQPDGPVPREPFLAGGDISESSSRIEVDFHFRARNAFSCSPKATPQPVFGWPSMAAIATGVTGTHLSRDGGQSWSSLGSADFAALSRAGQVVWDVGDKCSIARLNVGKCGREMAGGLMGRFEIFILGYKDGKYIHARFPLLILSSLSRQFPVPPNGNSANVWTCPHF